ncbi:MAG: S8 family serine peptidase [Candidatus Poribacteria bacterium]|nr:S8 family serine peptidase [Candidatus Poribacteria bacterium]
MTEKSIYIYILVLFINAQFVFAQSNSDNFSQIAHTPGELIVRLHPDASRKQLDALSKKLGAISVSPIFSPTTPAGQHPRLRLSYLIRFPAAWALEPLQRRYARHPAIEAVEMNRLNRPCAETVPNDPNYREQWNLAVMNMPQAWHIEQGNPEVTVAVVDGGVDMQHPEFRSQLWRNVGEIPGNDIDDDGNGYVDDINGWDFSDAPTLPGNGDWRVRDNEPEDEIGHGTRVSGIIAAEANNRIGIAGIAWRCRLMPLRADFKYGGGGYLQNDDVAAAIVYAADNGAQVVNMSWGDTVNAFIVADAVAYAYARGCVMVAAAGNAGAVGSWYPAGLKTVISVAWLTKERQLDSDSNFGATIDIAAPGEEILSTDLNGGYQNSSGTSIAAAHVSGVAALVVSVNPDYTNAEVQETLIRTAAPLFISGLVGAGSLDAYTALIAPTELIVQIDTSRMFSQDAESGNIEKIEIFGSAGGAGFTEYWLEYGIGEVPDLWLPLAAVKTKPKFNVCLYKWDTSALAEGRYTVRLSVKSKSGEIKRDRTVVEVDRTAPLISKHESQAWFSGNSVESVVLWETDEVSVSKIEIFQANGNIVRSVRSDSENRLHIVNLSDLGISPDAYMYRLLVENRAEGLRIDDNNGSLYEIETQDAPIYPLHLSQGTSAELALHAVGTPVDINKNGRLELITAEIGTNLAQIFEIADNGGFRQIFSFTERFLPRTIADTDTDGLIEILCSAPDVTFLLEQPAQGEFPTERIWEAPGKWGITTVDTDTDGTPEIFTRDDTTNSILIYEADGDNNYHDTATLENPTFGENRISANFAIDDFDGDGQMDILIGDNDGDIFTYEAIGNNQYRHTWTTTLPEGSPELFAAGDIDGDGKPEFAVCGKAGTKVGPIALDIRYHHWLLTVFSSDGNDTYRPTWTQRIRDVRDGGNGMTIADANNDGRNELCIAVAPNFYLVQYDGVDYRPIWHHPATNTFNPIVVDLNGDGENALLFNTDNVLTGFATSTTPNLQSEKQQSTPIFVAATRQPRLRDAIYSPPNQLSLVFDKPMGVSATHAGRYRLHKYGSVDREPEIHTPRSAILDKTQQRVLLTFPSEVFQTGNRYQIEALQLSDMDGANLADDARTLTITLPAPKLAETIVYPNPAVYDQVTFDNLPAGTHIYIYDVSGNCIASFAKTEREREKKVWDLSGISSGIYIYVLSSEMDRRVGKLSVIR